jgi:hypothetical protein
MSGGRRRSVRGIVIMNELNEVILGALSMGFAVAGLFFVQFWRKTHDRLFAIFAISFFVLAANRIGVALIDPQENTGHYVYWVRFAAFALILIAIVDKNRGSKPAAATGQAG